MDFISPAFPVGFLPEVNDDCRTAIGFGIRQSLLTSTPVIETHGRTRLPTELMYDIIYEAFIDSVHSMISPLSGDEFLVHRKNDVEIMRNHKTELTFIKRFASVSQQFREILRKLLSDVFELGGVCLDPSISYARLHSGLICMTHVSPAALLSSYVPTSGIHLSSHTANGPSTMSFKANYSSQRTHQSASLTSTSHLSIKFTSTTPSSAPYAVTRYSVLALRLDNFATHRKCIISRTNICEYRIGLLKLDAVTLRI